VPPE